MSFRLLQTLAISILLVAWNPAPSWGQRSEDRDDSNRGGSPVRGSGSPGKIAKWRTAHTVADSVINENNGNVGIGLSTSPGEKLHLGDGNVLIEGGGETAIKIKEDQTFTGGPSGTSQNPIFELGRIIQAGDGDPEFRFLYHDDNTSPRSVLEFDRKGIVASVKPERGSHFEGFISSTDSQPVFRLNSAAKMRLEMGEGGGIPPDVAVQREATATLSFITGTDERLRIDPIGNVGIGTTSPTQKLEIAGNVLAHGYLTPSDSQLKVHVTQLLNVLDKLEKVRGVSFEWKAAAGRKEIGVIAQELADVFPELVAPSGDQDYLAVDYGRLTGVLIEGIKELRTEKESQIKPLEAHMLAQEQQIAALQEQNAALAGRLAALEKMLVTLDKRNKRDASTAQ